MVIDEFWSCAFPIVDEAMTCPLLLTARRDEVSPVNARFVVVAFVVVLLVTVRELIVEEAETIKPRVVVGARYPDPCTVNAEKSEA
jgi:hypothetical protein